MAGTPAVPKDQRLSPEEVELLGDEKIVEMARDTEIYDYVLDKLHIVAFQAFYSESLHKDGTLKFAEAITLSADHRLRDKMLASQWIADRARKMFTREE